MSRCIATLFVLPLVFLLSFRNSAAADAPPRGTVLVEHAWQELAAGSEGYASSQNAWLRGYFTWRGAGKAASGAADWATLPPKLLGALRDALADSTTESTLRAGADEFADRLARVVNPADTVVVVLVIGGFEEPYTYYDAEGRRVTAIQLERFLVDPDTLGAAAQQWTASRRLWWPDAVLERQDLFPWCAYAVTGYFAPELRQRRMNDVASLAEAVLLQGFSTRFASALYPESKFAGARPPVSGQALAALRPKWREIGAAWFPLGTEPYLAAVYEPVVEDALPPGMAVAQAAAVLGAELTGEWLRATRISRTQDEAAEISRLGRLPTLSAWGLLEY